MVVLHLPVLEAGARCAPVLGSALLFDSRALFSAVEKIESEPTVAFAYEKLLRPGNR